MRGRFPREDPIGRKFWKAPTSRVFPNIRGCKIKKTTKTKKKDNEKKRKQRKKKKSINLIRSLGNFTCLTCFACLESRKHQTPWNKSGTAPEDIKVEELGEEDRFGQNSAMARGHLRTPQESQESGNTAGTSVSVRRCPGFRTDSSGACHSHALVPGICGGGVLWLPRSGSSRAPQSCMHAPALADSKRG